MPDNWRFSEGDIERELRDLGAGIEYPPTPDVSHTVRLSLDEEQARQSRRAWRWPPVLAPRWTAVAVALVLISIAALTPTMRTTLSDFFVSGRQTGSEAAGPAAKPESGRSEDRSRQEAGVASQAAGASAAGEEEATGCLSPSVAVEPVRAAPGATFRLRGYNFSGCERIAPATAIRIYFRQDGETWKLATRGADKSLAFDARLRVPAGARPGPAKVQVTTLSGDSVKMRFLVLREDGSP